MVAALFGMDAIVIGSLGVVLATFGVVAPFTGFVTAAFVGGLLALLAVVFAVIALIATRPGKGLAGRGQALLGLVTGGVWLLLLLGGASAGAGLPRINDITTNPDDPPQFEYATRDTATRDRDYSYPPGFAEQQRAGYPDLAPIALNVPPAQAFQKVVAAMQKLGMTITQSDEARGIVEGNDTSKLFRFVDDVTVRIRPGEGGGSIVDIRSKSRDGQGDVGANAKRIRAITSEIAAG